MSLCVVALVFLRVCFSQGLWDVAMQDTTLEGQIRKIHVFYRHGHREPLHGYPKDPHLNSEAWTNGPGQLTILGRKQAYNFGENLRNRYSFMLPDERAWKTVRATSSDSARTLMSSAVVLAGLIPPAETDRWSYIHWQPAPVYIDRALSTHYHCPRLSHLLKHQTYSPAPETKRLYDYVERHSGTTINTPSTLNNIYTCLEIQKQAYLVLPLWTYSVMNAMKMEAAKSFHSKNAEISRLRIGPILKKIVEYNHSDLKRPIKLYCTHDSIIGGLLGALNFNLTEPPNFMSAVIVEIREIKGRLHAQLWYRFGPYDDLIRLPWPSCGVRCPLHKLKEILKALIPDHRAKECELNAALKNKTSITIFIATVILIALAALGVVSGYCSFIFEAMKYEILYGNTWRIFSRFEIKN